MDNCKPPEKVRSPRYCTKSPNRSGTHACEAFLMPLNLEKGGLMSSEKKKKAQESQKTSAREQRAVVIGFIGMHAAYDLNGVRGKWNN